MEDLKENVKNTETSDNQISLSEKDEKIFIDAIVTGSEPNDDLKSAYKKSKEYVGNRNIKREDRITYFGMGFLLGCVLIYLIFFA